MVLKMKKKLFLNIFIPLIFCFVSIGSVNAQSSNDEQRLIGTWIEESLSSSLNGRIWVFNSDGTVSIGNMTYNYAIAGNKLIYYSSYNNSQDVLEYNISTDGRTLILIYPFSGGWSLLRKGIK
jgi:hypothetical protein